MYMYILTPYSGLCAGPKGESFSHYIPITVRSTDYGDSTITTAAATAADGILYIVPSIHCSSSTQVSRELREEKEEIPPNSHGDALKEETKNTKPNGWALQLGCN